MPHPTDPQSVLTLWTESLTALNLRVEAHDQDPAAVCVRIGRLDYQAIDLTLRLQADFGERSNSQAVERYEAGQASFTTAWDDEWTQTSRGDRGFAHWIYAALEAMVEAHLRWELERLYDAKQPDVSVRRLVLQLKQVQHFTVASIDLNPTLTELADLADTVVRAADGDHHAVQTLAQAAVGCSGTLDEPESTFAVLVGGVSWVLANEDRATFTEAIDARLEAETRRVAEASGKSPKAFHALKKVLDRAPAPVGLRINEWLTDIAAATLPVSEGHRELHNAIQRYQDLYREWSSYTPSAADPLEEGRNFLALEAEINRAWRQTLDAQTGLFRSVLETRLTADGRFVCGASGLVFGWMRNEGLHDEAVRRFLVQVEDLDLLMLQQRSHPNSFGNLINNALGAFLDSGNEAHIDLAVACLDALSSRISWNVRDGLHNVACVYARAGLIDRAIAAVEEAVSNGVSIRTMGRDSDLTAVHDHPDFVRLLDAA